MGNGSINYGLDCVENCHKYVYEDHPSSLLSEFDLACGDRKLLASLSTSVYWFAYLISCFIVGALSDRLGRKYVALCLQMGIGNFVMLSTKGVFCYGAGFANLNVFFFRDFYRYYLSRILLLTWAEDFCQNYVR